MSEPPPIRVVFAAFRALDGSDFGTVQNELLHRLEHEDRMKFAWRMLYRHCQDGVQIRRVISAVFEIKLRADYNGKLKQHKISMGEDFTGLRAAADRLSKFFGAIPISEQDSPVAAASARHENDRIRACRASLAWAETYVARFETNAFKTVHRDFPIGQQVGSPAMAFAKMFCTAVNDRIGQPLYEFVAAVTDVVYQTNETTDPDAIRVAWKGDQKKRAEAANPKALGRKNPRNPSRGSVRR